MNSKSRPAFMPHFESLSSAHITLTNVTRDRRYRGVPGHLLHLGSEEYSQKLMIRSNVMQVFVYLDINGSYE